LFKGIRIDDSLTLSHLFYADDAVFIGVSHEEVKAAANIIGSSTFSTPFNYLGVKVGMSSSRSLGMSQTYPRLYALENKKHITVAEKLSEVSLIVSFRRAPRGGVEEDQFLQLVDLVASVILSNSNDRWVWLLDSTGEYSISSARSYIDDLLLPTTVYHIVVALEQVLDLKTTSFEDVVGRLIAYEERVKEEDKANDPQDNLLYARTEYSNDNNDSSKERERGSYSRGRGQGRGQGHGRGNSQYQGQRNSLKNREDNEQKDKQHEKRNLSHIQCYRCNQYIHFVSKCPEQNRNLEVNLNETQQKGVYH
nr:RNA-directed DNA polymerase, eukaryota [Tanacetum cinerariifolium]